MSTFRERNDRKSRGEQGSSGGPRDGRQRGGKPGWDPTRPRFKPKKEEGSGWVWGRHAVEAALANPARAREMRLLATADRARELQPILSRHRRDLRPEIVESKQLTDRLPTGAVHQGVALRVAPLEPVAVEELGADAAGVILMLDQVTDPQNVGAILRSAAAFGARGVVLQDRNAPVLAGALAKAAAGAVDRIPVARVTNLSRALEKLSAMGWRSVGLAGEAEQTLAQALDRRPTVLVLGSEGEGIRRLVSEHCDALGRIPMPGGFESLNVSNAAAVALYETVRKAEQG
ncbi:MAG: 23S rRNA (guanosine(2251)-2'-O)-methyltransferase RlmB [Caulobacteraceae bacterium]|nr:23S rRNA (guanosine(2251)-2'-O)-methyltransferase RlmB [Caulobacteraceae bacterium]